MQKHRVYVGQRGRRRKRPPSLGAMETQHDATACRWKKKQVRGNRWDWQHTRQQGVFIGFGACGRRKGRQTGITYAYHYCMLSINGLVTTPSPSGRHTQHHMYLGGI